MTAPEERPRGLPGAPGIGAARVAIDPLTGIAPVTPVPVGSFVAGLRRLDLGTIGLMHYPVPSMVRIPAVLFLAALFMPDHAVTLARVSAGPVPYIRACRRHCRRVRFNPRSLA